MTETRKTKTKANKSSDSKKKPAATATSEPSATSDISALQEKITSLTATNRQLKRKIFDLYTIFEISRNFNAVLDYHILLDSFILTSLAQVAASKAAIFLEPRADAGLFVIAKHKGSGRFPTPILVFHSDSELVKHLAKLNRPVQVEEMIKSHATADEKRILEDFIPGLLVPLVSQSRLSGIFAIAEKISGREFQMDDMEFMSILGNQISVAIENARLYQSEQLTARQLRSTQEQLVQSERLAALGDMSAKVAHEINNPLGIIKNYLLLIRRSTEGNEQVDDYVDVVGDEIDRMARIVSELLDFHRPGGEAYHRIDLIEVLDDVLRLMERKIATNNIELIRGFGLLPVWINGAPDNLKQVLINLVINACDAMPEGGRLAIKLDIGDESIRVEVCDTGTGIPPEIIPRIFEPFFTTKDPGKGTGLGLSVCYGIIKKHRGTITYKNIETGGCFEIVLPKAKANDSD